MTPAQHLKRLLRGHVNSAIRSIEECEVVIAYETKPNQSTYRLSKREANRLNKVIEDTLECLRKLLVSI